MFFLGSDPDPVFFSIVGSGSSFSRRSDPDPVLSRRSDPDSFSLLKVRSGSRPSPPKSTILVAGAGSDEFTVEPGVQGPVRPQLRLIQLLRPARPRVRLYLHAEGDYTALYSFIM